MDTKILVFLRELPGKDWNWFRISNNSNITWNIIEENPDIPWNWFMLVVIVFLKKKKHLYLKNIKNI